MTIWHLYLPLAVGYPQQSSEQINHLIIIVGVIIIVGGGAAAFFGAIACGTTNPRA